MLTSYRDSVTLATGFLELLKPGCISLLVILMLISCQGVSEQDREAIRQALADSTDHTSETWGVTIELLEKGQRFVHITSPYAQSIESRNNTTTILHGPVFIEIRDENGEPESYVTAQRVTYQTRTSEFYLEGNVRVETVGNKTLTSESLTWYQFSREIEATGFVTIVTPTDSIVGTGLSGDDRLHTYTIHRVSGSFTLEDRRND